MAALSPTTILIPSPTLHFSRRPFFALPSPHFQGMPRALAVNGGEVSTAVLQGKAWVKDGGRVRPCELYVCNLPRSVDVDQLLDFFTPYGTVNSVEVSRDAVTGLSRGCGYVTMSSLNEAKAAILALDKSDVGGREMRVRFSGDMGSVRRREEAFRSTPKRNLVFETPYRIYVGNLAWSVKPEDLRQYFSQFGTVASARLLFDRNKQGKKRVYGFVSFSSADELKRAFEANGMEFHGRALLVREFNREEQ